MLLPSHPRVFETEKTCERSNVEVIAWTQLTIRPTRLQPKALGFRGRNISKYTG